MTPPRPETTDLPEEPEDKPRGLQLSATQVAAGALAAVSSAVVASFFGLAGTLIGAALASVTSTVSAALYSSSLARTNERLRHARSQLTGRQARVAGEPDAAPATRALPARLDPRRAPAPRRWPSWTRVAVYAAAVFVMAMGIVTGIELVGQQPVSALVGATEPSRTTTLGAITGTASSGVEQEDAPSTPSAPTPGAPVTGTSAPAGPTGDGSTDDSGGREPSPATPTGTTAGRPTTSSEAPAEEPSVSTPAATAEAEPTP